MRINLKSLLEQEGADELILGRHSEVLDLNHPTISRLHALIQRNASNQIVMTDLKSRNGIRVNGKKIHSAILISGDVITIGALRFIIEENEIIHGVAQWLESSCNLRRKMGW